MEEDNVDKIAQDSPTAIPFPVVLIDGMCVLCQGATKFIIGRDPSKSFYFASQQSDIGKAWLDKGDLPTDRIDTIVLIENGNYYTESTAALRISRHLQYPWPLLYTLIAVPKFIRDAIYRVIARHRYRWFGKSDQCMLPPPDLKNRFLD